MERRPRAADDFAAIRARMEELKRERNQAAPVGPKERLDERRWRTSDELRARDRIIPRSNARPRS
jgi:hypothetical protein